MCIRDRHYADRVIINKEVTVWKEHLGYQNTQHPQMTQYGANSLVELPFNEMVATAIRLLKCNKHLVGIYLMSGI